MTKQTYQQEYLNFCISGLQSYYQDNDLTIIGLNDIEGINKHPNLLKKNFLDYIGNLLKTKNFSPRIINIFSELINKTEHIDYLLENNLSLEEIKLSQLYSVISLLEKQATDLKLPKSLGNLAYIYKLIYNPQKHEEKIFLTKMIQRTQEPTIIYSSGFSNLMCEIGTTPLIITKDYENRKTSPNYTYTCEKSTNPNTLTKVLTGIETNFTNILTLNNNADIYTLGTFIPKIQTKGLEILIELLEKYNESLQRLCQKYNITYINPNLIENREFNNIAAHLIEAMYQRKCEPNEQLTPTIINNLTINNYGPRGMGNKIIKEYEKNVASINKLEDEYAKLRQEQIIDEQIRELEVFQKVLVRSKTIR